MARRPMRSNTGIFHARVENTTDVFCGGNAWSGSTSRKAVSFQLFGHPLPCTIDAWPESTDALCWHCRHPFDTVPVAVPMQFENGTWNMRGMFCGWPCAKRFVLDQDYFNVASVLFNLKQVAAKFGVTEPIVQAPPFTALTAFGGHLDIEAFRGQTRVLTTVDYPFYNFSMGFVAGDTEQRPEGGMLRRPESVSAQRTLVSSAENESLYASFLASDRSKQRPKKKRQATIGSMGSFMKKKKKT